MWAEGQESFEAPEGYAANNLNCDDTTIASYPEAPEPLDSLDNDCDVESDEDIDDDGCTAPTGESEPLGALSLMLPMLGVAFLRRQQRRGRAPPCCAPLCQPGYSSSTPTEPRTRTRPAPHSPQHGPGSTEIA